MKKSSFEKFINPKVGGAKKKEALRQEKKKVKAELRQQGDAERKQNEAKYGLVTKEKKTLLHLPARQTILVIMPTPLFQKETGCIQRQFQQR